MAGINLLNNLRKTNIFRIFKNFYFLIIGQVLSGLIFIVTSIYAARVLGPAEFGKLGFAESVLMFFLIFVNFGLDIIGMREIARNKELSNDYAERILSLKLIFSFFSFIALLIFTLYIKKPIDTKYTIILYGLSLFPLSLFLDWFYQGIEKMQYRSLALVIREILYATGIFLFVHNSTQLLPAAIIFLISRVGATIFLLVLFSRQVGRSKIKLHYDKFDQGLIKSALPVGLGVLFAWILLYLDIFLISFFRGDYEVGLYNVAFKPILYGMILCESYYTAAFPAISVAATNNEGLLKKLIGWSSKGMLLFWLPFAILASFFAEPIIGLVYGEKFIKAAVAFRLLPWWLVILSINTAYAKGLIGSNKEYQFSFIVFIRTVLIITFNIIFIPRFGFVGAAIAKVVSELAVLPVYHLAVNKIVKISLSGLLRPLICGVIMALFIWLTININILIMISGALIIYCLAIIIFEHDNLKNIFQLN
jgi:O-antigen/teichoic acid export membrane protein